MSLSGKVAIVTGGATGIGFATVKVFLERGARVAIAQSDATVGAEAAASLKSEAVVAFPVDIRDKLAVGRCVAAVVDRWGAVDILVNNASVTGPSALSRFV